MNNLVNITLLAVSLFSLSATAQDAELSKRETIEEMLVLVDADSMIDTIYSQMDQVMQNMGREMGVRPDEQVLVDRYTSKMTELMKAEISWEKMKEPSIAIYMNYFTAQELTDILAFYKSSSGQSMLKKMPEVVKASMVMSQDLVKPLIPRIQELSQELAADLKAHRSAQANQQ